MEPDDQPIADQAGAPTPAARKRTPKVFAGAALVAFLLLAVGLIPRLSQGRRLGEAVESLKSGLPVVSVVRLSGKSNDADLTLPSNIQAIEQTTINARTSGYLAERFVDIGSKVTKGQLLAVVGSPELDQQLAQTAAEATKAQAGLGSALADSAKQLAAISAASAEVLRSEAARSQAKADLVHLQAKEAQARAAVNVARSHETELVKREAAASADLGRARSQLALAQKTLGRWRDLEKAEAVAGQDVDEKQAAYESCVSVREAADATLSSAHAAAESAREAVRVALSEVEEASADVQSGYGHVRAADAVVASSKANVTAVKAAYRASRSGVASAAATISSDQANVRRVQALQSFERIRAPFDGVITARNVDTGDLVNSSPGGTGASDQANAVTRSGLFGLAKTDALRAQINVPEDSASLVHEGQATEVTVDEYPRRIFKGLVFHVSGALDTASRTLLVEVRVPNLDGSLKPGMYAKIKFLSSRGPSILWLPANALIFNASGTRVAVVDEAGILRYLPVRLGRDLGDRIEILDGLTGTERVVTNPDDSIPDGARVKPVEEHA
ncbi:MAG TPA: efflux RND transporter periplasmic adaptor subunit [Fimbriimonadaceae bacterium]|nr:efflux RND transporter periplasmic adaptor subunit [Fimbriimonadaceae bacterium]